MRPVIFGLQGGLLAIFKDLLCTCYYFFSLVRYHCPDIAFNNHVTCCFKTFGRFEISTAILIPVQCLEMAWPF